MNRKFKEHFKLIFFTWLNFLGAKDFSVVKILITTTNCDDNRGLELEHDSEFLLILILKLAARKRPVEINISSETLPLYALI